MRVVVEHGKFLDSGECDRCHIKLRSDENPTGELRVKSFFTWGGLCCACKKEEEKVCNILKNRGYNIKKYENKGKWPEIER